MNRGKLRLALSTGSQNPASAPRFVLLAASQAPVWRFRRRGWCDMGSRGPRPKRAAHRRKGRPGGDGERLRAGGDPVGPELPRTYYDGSTDERVRFLKATRRWFETWRTSPQATKFSATAWQRLLLLARLVDKYLRSPSTKLLSEIRLNEKQLGGTPGDLERLGWDLDSAPPQQRGPDADDNVVELRQRISEGLEGVAGDGE